MEVATGSPSSADGCWASAKAFLDAHFQDGEESLGKAAPLLDELIARNAELQSKRAATEEAARAGAARTREVAEVARRELAELQQKRGELSAMLGKHLSKSGQLKPDLTQLLHKIKQLQEVQSYVQLLIHVHHLRDQIHQTAESATKSAVDYLLQLLTIKTTVSKRSCSNLGEHINQTFEQCLGSVVAHLKERVSGSFEAILWPKLPAASQPLNPPAPDSAALDLFRKSFSLLLLVQLSVEGIGSESNQQADISGDGAQEKARGTHLWGMQLLLAPLVKRFRYHFMSKRPTNNIEKPEWYLMDTREVIRLNSDFLAREVQPLLEKKNLGYYNAKIELIKGMIEIIKEKTKKDVDAISKNDAIFVHNLNEMLDFHKAVVEVWDYPSERWIEGLPNVPCVLDVYTERLDRWLELEEKLATEHLRAMLEPSADPWSLYYSLAALGSSEEAHRESVQLHEMKPTKSANALITTLSSVTERYRTLPRLSHRLRFMHEIQITLLAQYMAKVNESYEDDFAALSRHHFSKVCGLINSLKYCGAVLKDWGEQLFFLELRRAELAIGDSGDYALADAPSQPDELESDTDVDSSTVFDDVVTHYRRLRKTMAESVIDVIVRTFKSHTGSYLAKKRIWKSDFEAHDEEGAAPHKLDLSPSVCEGLSRLRRDMAELHGHLSQPVSAKVWQQVAKELNDYIFMQIISRRHHFHRMGALQFQHDMRALFLIFRDFTTSPQNFFKDVKESAVVLTLTAEARERMRGLLAPLLATPAADTRVSLLTSRSRAAVDGDEDAFGQQTSLSSSSTGEEEDDDDNGNDHLAEPFARFGLFKLTPRQIDLVLSLRIDHHGL